MLLLNFFFISGFPTIDDKVCRQCCDVKLAFAFVLYVSEKAPLCSTRIVSSLNIYFCCFGNDTWVFWLIHFCCMDLNS